MKINISRQSIYLLVLSLVLLIFVLLFAFLLLIPEGKNYRENRTALKKENILLQKYLNYNNETLETLKELQSSSRNVITAFESDFNSQRFQKQHRQYFSLLSLAEKSKVDEKEEFAVYEVNATSKINSPKSFYGFLDAINKSDWIISINFPINFKREGEFIKSSFTMKVYSNPEETNSNLVTEKEAL